MLILRLDPQPTRRRRVDEQPNASEHHGREASDSDRRTPPRAGTQVVRHFHRLPLRWRRSDRGRHRCAIRGDRWCCCCRRRLRHVGRFRAILLPRAGVMHDRIHPLPSERIHIGRRAENHRQHVMTGRRLSEVHIRFQTNPLEIANLLRRHHIIEILGYGVRVEPHACADHLGRTEPQPPHRVTRAMHQVLGKLARFDLLCQLLLVDRVENVIEIREQSAESKTHGGGGARGRKSGSRTKLNTATRMLPSVPNSGAIPRRPCRKIARFDRLPLLSSQQRVAPQAIAPAISPNTPGSRTATRCGVPPSQHQAIQRNATEFLQLQLCSFRRVLRFIAMEHDERPHRNEYLSHSHDPRMQRRPLGRGQVPGAVAFPAVGCPNPSEGRGRRRVACRPFHNA